MEFLKNTICLKCGPDITANKSGDSDYCWICHSKLITYNDVPIEVRNRWQKEKEKDAERLDAYKNKEALNVKFFGLLVLALVFVIMPSVIRLIFSFFGLVIFGDWTMSEFTRNIDYNSYKPVIDFYISLYYKLIH